MHMVEYCVWGGWLEGIVLRVKGSAMIFPFAVNEFVFSL